MYIQIEPAIAINTINNLLSKKTIVIVFHVLNLVFSFVLSLKMAISINLSIFHLNGSLFFWQMPKMDAYLSD